MPAKKYIKIRDDAGRPEKTIDWNYVDFLLSSGCQGTEIAGYFGVHPNTFYRRVEKEKGVNFSEYMAAKREMGKAMIKATQFKQALKGDRGMLIWLGKNILGQSEMVTHKGSAVINVMNYAETKKQIEEKEENGSPEPNNSSVQV